jgi:membrane-associated phospholipid phosphatase
MPDPTNLPTPLDLIPQLPWTRDRRVAKWISRVTSPPILAVGGTVMTAAQITGAVAWLWAVFSIFFSIIIPSLFVLWLLRRGKVTDFDVYVRKQRFWPYVVGISCSAVAWIVMAVGQAPHFFIIVSGAAATQGLVMFLINQRWKISVHTSGTACFAILTWQLFGPAGATVLLAIPIVAWSRVRLGRHTVGQVTAGAALGAGLIYAVFLIFA